MAPDGHHAAKPISETSTEVLWSMVRQARRGIARAERRGDNEAADRMRTTLDEAKLELVSRGEKVSHEKEGT